MAKGHIPSGSSGFPIIIYILIIIIDDLFGPLVLFTSILLWNKTYGTKQFRFQPFSMALKNWDNDQFMQQQAKQNKVAFVDFLFHVSFLAAMHFLCWSFPTLQSHFQT